MSRVEVAPGELRASAGEVERLASDLGAVAGALSRIADLAARTGAAGPGGELLAASERWDGSVRSMGLGARTASDRMAGAAAAYEATDRHAMPAAAVGP